MATGLQTGMRTGSRAGLAAAGRGVQSSRLQSLRRFFDHRCRPALPLFLLFGLGLAVGLAWRERPSPLELRLRHCLASSGGEGCAVSVAELPEGRWAVGVGVPRNARLSREAAEALTRTELRLGPADSLAVVTLPDRPPAPPFLEAASLALLLGGLWAVARRVQPRLLAWWEARRAPPPPEVLTDQVPRCVIRVRPRDLRRTQAALQAFRRRMARERGLLLCPITVVAGSTPVEVLDGTNYSIPDDPGELIGQLERRVARYLGFEEICRMLEQWRRTHPGVIGALVTRYPVERLAVLIRAWVGRGYDLRNLDVWAEKLLTLGSSYSDRKLLDKLCQGWREGC